MDRKMACGLIAFAFLFCCLSSTILVEGISAYSDFRRELLDNGSACVVNNIDLYACVGTERFKGRPPDAIQINIHRPGETGMLTRIDDKSTLRFLGLR